MKTSFCWIKVPLLCLVCFGLGITACWAVLSYFHLTATRLFYYQVQNPYEKDLSKEEMAEMDTRTVVLREAMYRIYTLYYKQISFKEISADFMRRKNKALDEHTLYVAPEDTSEFKETFYNKDFGGIGVNLFSIRTDSTDKKKTKVIVGFVFPKTPAERAGVLKGDTIIAVDGKKVFLADEAKNLIRGEINTTTVLEIIRPGSKDILWKTIERKSIVIPGVTWELVKEDTTIGLINIFSFSLLEPSLLQLALSSLEVSGVKKVILNLRDSRGGIFGHFLLSSFLFMDSNDTLAVAVNRKTKTVFDSTYIVNYLKGKNQGRFKNLKIVCLINGNTGSASEFFAKTLQRWGYTLIGEPTAGMNTMLRRFSLSDGSIMLIAIEKMYFGSKQEEIPETGIVPNILVKNDPNSKKDLQLERAIEILQKGGGG